MAPSRGSVAESSIVPPMTSTDDRVTMRDSFSSGIVSPMIVMGTAASPEPSGTVMVAERAVRKSVPAEATAWANGCTCSEGRTTEDVR